MAAESVDHNDWPLSAVAGHVLLQFIGYNCLLVSQTDELGIHCLPKFTVKPVLSGQSKTNKKGLKSIWAATLTITMFYMKDNNKP